MILTCKWINNYWIEELPVLNWNQMPVFVDDYFCILFSSLVEKKYNDEIWLTKAF